MAVSAGVEFLQADPVVLFPLTSVVAALVTAQAVMAADGSDGPGRWLLQDREVLVGRTEPVAAAQDPLSRIVEHVRRRPVGVRPILTLLPPAAEEDAAAEPPTIALVARAHDRTIVSLTRLRVRADDGQDVVMQRTVVSDLLAGRRFALTVYEDHTLGDAAVRLMGVGMRVTFRLTFAIGGWRFRVELLASSDLGAEVSAYLALTGVLHPPPLPR